MGASLPVLGKTRTLRNVLMLALFAAGNGAVVAKRLDKDSCKKLRNEVAYVVNAGAREDMEQGPDWAVANLTRERLQKIKRLIELEEQLEFRCNVRHNKVAAIAPKQRPVLPDMPERKPDPASISTNSTAVDEGHAPTPAKIARQGSDKIAKDEAELVKERSVIVNDTAKKDLKTVRAAISTASAAPAAKASVSPSPVPPPPPKPAARTAAKKAYVSPSEVNPFFVTGYGTPR
jgi:hypothetical protein